jgi:2-iminobutanoate/2-iminopropanoate deaminase
VLERKGKVVIAVVVLLAVGSCASPPQQESAPEIQFLNSPEMEALRLPFSEAVRVGSTLYLSGQLGNVPGTTELVPGGIAAETRQALDNIKAILERNGSRMDRVAKCTVFLADIAEWPEMNEVYRTYFSNPPARSALAASGLALGARVEIECIAVVGDGRPR